MTSPQRKYQVFLSSTFSDLSNERKLVTERIIEMGLIPSGMELFPATSASQLQYICKVIDDCDYYILIVGGRYGSMTPDGVSFTEAEYDYAVEQRKYVMAFIHSQPEMLPSIHVDQATEARTKLQAFRAKVSAGRIVKYWNNPVDLAQVATTSLHHAIQNEPGVGWIRGDRTSNELELTRLRDQVQQHWRVRTELEQAQRTLEETNIAVLSYFQRAVKPASQADKERWLANCAPAEVEVQRQRLNSITPVFYADRDVILP